MKLHGKTWQAPLRLVEIVMLSGDKLVLKVAALPADHQEVTADLLPEPPPPRDVARMASRAVLRDPKTQQPVLVENPHDPAYQLALSRVFRSRMARTVRVALREDTAVEWSAPEPDWAAISDVAERRRAALDFYLALSSEMAGAGLGQHQLLEILRVTAEQSGAAASDMEAHAAATFPDREGAGERGE